MKPDFDMPRSAIERAIEEWILNERDRAMLKRRLLDGVCFEPLAEEFSLSVQQTKARISKAQARLFKHLHI